MTTADELRDAITIEYEDVRVILRQLRQGDLAASSASGVPIWRLAMDIALAPDREARAARRIAEGKSPGGSLLGAPLSAIRQWRRERAFAKAERADFLTAWENGFNELFACVNEIAEEPPDNDTHGNAAARTAALACLRDGISRVHAEAEVLRQALGLQPPG